MAEFVAEHRGLIPLTLPEVRRLVYRVGGAYPGTTGGRAALVPLAAATSGAGPTLSLSPPSSITTAAVVLSGASGKFTQLKEREQCRVGEQDDAGDAGPR